MSGAVHLGTYVRELKKRLPPHVFQPAPSRLLWLVPHLAIIAGALAALASFDLPPAWLLPLSVVIGSSFGCLGFLGHEVAHGSVVRTPWLRSLASGLCFAPFVLPARVWHRWHNVEHHGHTQHPDDDPDTMATLEAYRERPALQALFRLAPGLRSLLTFAAFSFWFSVHSLLMLGRYFREFRPRERALIVAQTLIPLAFWAGILLWLGPVKFAFAYLFPLAVGNFVIMSYIATNHMLNPLSEVNDPLLTSLSLTTPRLLDWWHLRFSHHTEHHIFPSVNPKFAPLIKARLKELWPERYHELPHWQALRLLWKTPRLYQDPRSLIDPRRGLVYPVLGEGLAPGNVRPRRLPAREKGTGHPARVRSAPGPF